MPSFAEIRKALDRAQSQGYGQNTTVRDFAKLGEYLTGDPSFHPVAKMGMFGEAVSKGSVALDEAINSSGIPEKSGQLFQRLGDMFGVDPEASRAVGEALPRGAVNFLPLAAGGPFSVAAAGAMVGSDAFEKTGSVGQAALGAVTPYLGGKLAEVGSKAAMGLASKLPIPQIGLFGGQMVEKAVEGAAAEALPIGTTVVQKAATTLADKVAAYMGGQVAANAGFLGLNVAQEGTDAFSKESLFGLLATNIPFALADLHKFAKPMPLGKAEYKYPETPPATPLKSERAMAEYYNRLKDATTDIQREMLSRQFGYDVGQEVLKSRARLGFEQEQMTALETARNQMDLAVKEYSDVYQDPRFKSPEALTEETMKDLKVLPDPVRKIVEDYQKQLKVIDKEFNAKVETLTKGSRSPRAIFGVVHDELNLDQSLLSKPLEARTQVDYFDALENYLPSDIITDIYKRHTGHLPTTLEAHVAEMDRLRRNGSPEAQQALFRAKERLRYVFNQSLQSSNLDNYPRYAPGPDSAVNVNQKEALAKSLGIRELVGQELQDSARRGQHLIERTPESVLAENTQKAFPERSPLSQMEGVTPAVQQVLEHPLIKASFDLINTEPQVVKYDATGNEIPQGLTFSEKYETLKKDLSEALDITTFSLELLKADPILNEVSNATVTKELTRLTSELEKLVYKKWDVEERTLMLPWKDEIPPINKIQTGIALGSDASDLSISLAIKEKIDAGAPTEEAVAEAAQEVMNDGLAKSEPVPPIIDPDTGAPIPRGTIIKDLKGYQLSTGLEVKVDENGVLPGHTVFANDEGVAKFNELVQNTELTQERQPQRINFVNKDGQVVDYVATVNTPAKGLTELKNFGNGWEVGGQVARLKQGRVGVLGGVKMSTSIATNRLLDLLSKATKLNYSPGVREYMTKRNLSTDHKRFDEENPMSPELQLEKSKIDEHNLQVDVLQWIGRIMADPAAAVNKEWAQRVKIGEDHTDLLARLASAYDIWVRNDNEMFISQEGRILSAKKYIEQAVYLYAKQKFDFLPGSLREFQSEAVELADQMNESGDGRFYYAAERKNVSGKMKWQVLSTEEAKTVSLDAMDDGVREILTSSEGPVDTLDWEYRDALEVYNKLLKQGRLSANSKERGQVFGTFAEILKEVGAVSPEYVRGILELAARKDGEALRKFLVSKGYNPKGQIAEIQRMEQAKIKEKENFSTMFDDNLNPTPQGEELVKSVLIAAEAKGLNYTKEEVLAVLQSAATNGNLSKVVKMFKQGSDGMLFELMGSMHTQKEVFSDGMLPPEVYFDRLLDKLGVEPGSKPVMQRDFLAMLGAARDIKLGDLFVDGPVRLGATSPVTRDIWLANPESLTGWIGKDKTRTMMFVAAHEAGHNVWQQALEGKYGAVASEKIREAIDWAKTSSAADRQDVMDLMKEWMPKEWAEIPEIAQLLNAQKTGSSAATPSEWMATAHSIFQVGSLKGKGGEKISTLLPGPIRKAFDWVYGHMQKLAKLTKMYMAGRGNMEVARQAHKVLKAFETLRKDVRKADHNIASIEHLGNFEPGKVNTIRTSMMNFVDPTIATLPGAKEILQLTSGEFGDVTLGDKLMSAFDTMITRTEDLAATHGPAAAKPLAALVYAYGAKRGAINHILKPLIGRTDAQGSLKFDNPAWRKLASSKPAWSLLMDMRNEQQVNKIAFVNPDASGRLIFDSSLMSPELRAKYGQFTPETRKMIGEMMTQFRTSQDLVNSEIFKTHVEVGKTSISHVLGLAMPERWGDTEALGAELFDAVSNNDQALIEQIGLKINNQAAFDSALRTAGVFVKDAQKVMEFIQENPHYASLRRNGNIVVKFTHPSKAPVVESYDTAKEAQAAKERMAKEGYTSGKPVIKSDNQQGLRLTSEAMERLQRREQELKDEIATLHLGDEMTDKLTSEINFSATLQQALAAQSIYRAGSNRKLTSGYEKLDPMTQHINYVTAVTSALHKRRLNTFFDYAMDNPELANKQSLRKEMEMRRENYLTPDKESGRKLSKTLAAWFLGFNIPSHMVELMQPLMTMLPELRARQVGGLASLKHIASANAEIASYYKDAMIRGKNREGESWELWKDPETRELMKLAAERLGSSGHMSALDEVIGFDQRQFSDVMEGKEPTSLPKMLMSGLNFYADSAMLMYSKFTQHNRYTGLLAGYKAFREQGMSHQVAMEQALDFETIVNKSSGRAGRQGAPWQGNKFVGHVFYALQGYTTGWMGQLARYARHGFDGGKYEHLTPADRKAARSAFFTQLGTQLALGGILGLPFAGAMLKLAEELSGESLRDKVFTSLDELTDDPIITDMAARGMSGAMLEAAGVPIDLHSRFALGGMLGFNEYDGYSATSLMGPTASMVKGFWNFGKTLAQEQDIMKAVAAGGPPATRKLAEMAAGDNTVKVGQAQQKRLEGMEGLLYKLGFPNRDVVKMREFSRMAENMKSADTAHRAKAAQEILTALKTNPSEARQLLRLHADRSVPQEYPGVVRARLIMEETQSLAQRVADLQESQSLPRNPKELANRRIAPQLDQLGQAMNMPPVSEDALTRKSLRDQVSSLLGSPVKFSYRMLR